MKKKIFVIGIVVMFFGLSIISNVGGNSVSIEEGLKNSSNEDGKMYRIQVRYEGRPVNRAEVEIWEGTNKNVGLYYSGYTNSWGIWSTIGSSYNKFKHDVRVTFHAEKVIDGEKKADTNYDITDSNGIVFVYLDLHEPKGTQKEKTDFVKFPIFKKFFSMLPALENLIIEK